MHLWNKSSLNKPGLIIYISSARIAIDHEDLLKFALLEPFIMNVRVELLVASPGQKPSQILAIDRPAIPIELGKLLFMRSPRYPEVPAPARK